MDYPSNSNVAAVDLAGSKHITKMVILANIGVMGIVTILLALFIVMLVPPAEDFDHVPAHMARVLGFGLGLTIIGWSLILFKTRLFDSCFINVKENCAFVLGNQTKYDAIPEDPTERTKMFKRQSMREIGQGFRGKWPWEVIVGQPIDLRPTMWRVEPIKCYTNDDIEVELTPKIAMAPLIGYLCNFIRRDPETIWEYLGGNYLQYMITWMKEHDETAVYRKLKELKNEFRSVMDGVDAVSREEMEWGAAAVTFQITNVRRSERYQKAAEIVKMLERMGTGLSSLMSHFAPGREPDPNVIVSMASNMLGGQTRSQMFLIPGIEQALTAILRQKANDVTNIKAAEIVKT